MSQDDGATIAAAWFLKSEGKEPLGRIYRTGADAIPAIGMRLSDEARWRDAEIVGIRELGPTCAMRRFEVILRILRLATDTPATGSVGDKI